MRFIVSGSSMEPTFHQGDRLWVSNIPFLHGHINKFVSRKLEIKRGDVVVLSHPFRNKLILKRIERILPDAYEVAGDNPFESEDSRSFGAIKKEQIVGKVLFRY
ncbi:MAG: S26 family signal peptidase [Candidatus Portnoybacteria bacterium]|nr:S26 family signal peptidase [Candidatus Portnoybacteria bacterium]